MRRSFKSPQPYSLMPIYGQKAFTLCSLSSLNIPRPQYKFMAFSISSPLKSFFLFLFFNISCALKDSITLNQAITGSQKLTSKGGKFELGFFKPGKSSYYYVGIWYNLNFIPQQTPVWVANRETPLTEISKTNLAISENGNLVLSNQTNPLIWSTNITHHTPTVLAVLLDTGNLVLRDASNPNTTLWQSFDHPTHTWLPGGKLGLNKATKELQRLTSWKNDDDPAPGIFNLEIDPNGTSQYFILWNNSFNFWSSGTWNGHIFSLVPEMTANYIYDFDYISNDKENYFTYTVKSDYPLTSRFIMDLSGQIKQLTWVTDSGWSQFWAQPRKQCQVHALCGPFGVCNEVVLPFCNCVRGFSENSPLDWALSDWTEGCVRNTKLECEKDGFFTMPNTRMPDNPQSVQAGSASDCESSCLNECSCTAYTYNSSGCLVWQGGLLHLQDRYDGPNRGTLFVRLAASELPVANKNKLVIIVSVVCAIVVLLVIVVWLVCCCRKRSSRKRNVVEGGLIAFRYSELQRATKNFSEKLGGGGFGSVFKGVMLNSSNEMIAVKQLEGVRQGEKQFRTEVSTIGTIQHVNLVRLRGFCSEGLHKLLVYEYMPNGSLDSKLFQNDSEVLDWKTRYQIAVGIARGLTYLHEQCRDCIVHCDIKPENILLDACFVPKVADFGLAKLIGRDFSRVLTTMRGTRGYLAPEWISGVAITAKADVYSYGMMLFEIISGKRNSENLEGQKIRYFPSLAASKMVEGEVMSLVDRKLKGEELSEEEVVRACKVACWCIQDEEDSRPSMSQVIQMLEGVMEASMPPIPRALHILAENPENIDFFSEFSSNAASSNYTSSRTKSSSTESRD